MDNMVFDKDALMNSLFLGKGLTEDEHRPQGEVITKIDPSMLVDFHSNELGRQPYRVRDNEELAKLIDSVTRLGVFEPIIARPDPLYEGKYEIISGHRRNTAALRAGLPDVPMIKRNMTDDEANIIVCDANLHREDIMPSEKGWAYRLKLEAMNRQGHRTDLTCDPVGHKLENKKSIVILAEESEDSKTQIQRYIRLTYLLPDLLEMVDEGRLRFRVGVELSYLKQSEQEALSDVMICDKVSPSLEQAQELKQMSKEGRDLTPDLIHVFLKKEVERKEKLNAAYINRYLPPAVKKMTMQKKMSYTAKALEFYNSYITEHPKELESL